VFGRLKRVFAALQRWFHPWDQQPDQTRAEELYRRYIDFLG
jgi:hypothetical protein